MSLRNPRIKMSVMSGSCLRDRVTGSRIEARRRGNAPVSSYFELADGNKAVCIVKFCCDSCSEAGGWLFWTVDLNASREMQGTLRRCFLRDRVLWGVNAENCRVAQKSALGLERGSSWTGSRVDRCPQCPLPEFTCNTSSTASWASRATCSRCRFSAFKKPAATAVFRNASKPFQ